jgi:hypothetical protein
MEAQLLVVYQNGFAEAREPKLRDRFEVIDIKTVAEIKTEIWRQLNRLNRAGHILVRWNDKTYLCEMKQDKKGYTRTEIEYHPYLKHFSI